MNCLKYNDGLIRKMADKFVKWAKQERFDLEFDDAYQIMRLAFIHADKHYDESKGVKFSTYYYKCASSEMSDWIKSNKTKRLEFKQFGEDFSIDDIMDDQLSPEKTLDFNMKIGRIRNNLTPRSRVYFDIMLEPPETLLEELRMRNHWRCEAGEGKRRSISLNWSDISKFLQVPKHYSYGVIKEISDAVRREL